MVRSTSSLPPQSVEDAALPSSTIRARSGRDLIFGDYQYFDEMMGTHVKGNLVRARSRYIRERYGFSTLMSVADALPPAARGYLLEPPLVSSWVKAGPMYEIDRAIIEGPMRSDIAEMFEFGANIAMYDLPNIYKVVLTMLSRPSFLMRRLGMVFGMYFKEGVMTAESDEGKAMVTLSDRVLPLYMCSYGVSGWFAASVETYGIKEKRVTHLSCRHRGHATCNWVVTWAQR